MLNREVLFMKKKLFLGIIVTILLFTIGCDNSRKNNSSDASVESNEFVINDISLKFDKDASFGNFNYKTALELEQDDSSQAIYLEYKNEEIYNGRFVFRISLAYSDEISLEDFLEGRETTNKKINEINWKLLSIDNKSDNKDTTSLIYAVEKDNNIYVISFIIFNESKVNINKLANSFMNGVTIK